MREKDKYYLICTLCILLGSLLGAVPGIFFLNDYIDSAVMYREGYFTAGACVTITMLGFILGGLAGYGLYRIIKFGVRKKL
jgi:hypothetical protein